MSTFSDRTGHAPHIPMGSDPHGPRVKRPGWKGWFCYAPDGSLVPDGHVERMDLTDRRRPASPDIAAPRERCRYGHGPEDQTTNAKGWAVCRQCARDAAKRSRDRRAA